MLYYGDTKTHKDDEEGKIGADRSTEEKSEEQCRVRNLLHHCIMGLTSIQHNGNMVIKMYEMHDVATVGIIFTLYNLFQRVCIVKPYATTFLSSRQYLVCKGLKQRRPQQVITQLAKLQAFLLDAVRRDEQRLVHC